jgi:hypothetical protein
MDRSRGTGDAVAVTPDRAVGILYRVAIVGLSLVLAAYAGLFAVLAWPDPLFRHDRGGGLVTFHSTAPLPPEATRLAQEVTAAFIASPLGLPSHDVDVWLVDEGWPVSVFFAGSPGASGLTYPVTSTRNVFLRHADIPQNRLVRGTLTVPPPRTLSYYLIHEITHLMVAERVGALADRAHATLGERGVRRLRGPRSGAAADGPRGAGSGAPLPASDIWGTYARERVCVTLALDAAFGRSGRAFRA